MDHIENLHNSLSRYFKTLEYTGHYNKKGVDALLIYTFLVDAVLEGLLLWYLEDKDIPVLNSMLKCLQREKCLILPIVQHQRIGKPRANYMYGIFRKDETERLRFTYSDNPRVTETPDLE